MFGACRYTSASTAIRHFLEILSELDAADQRRFLRFVTGSPRLPPGGLSALHPRCAPAFVLPLSVPPGSGLARVPVQLHVARTFTPLLEKLFFTWTPVEVPPLLSQRSFFVMLYLSSNDAELV